MLLDLAQIALMGSRMSSTASFPENLPLAGRRTSALDVVVVCWFQFAALIRVVSALLDKIRVGFGFNGDFSSRVERR
jgi:hypothetical protein